MTNGVVGRIAAVSLVAVVLVGLLPSAMADTTFQANTYYLGVTEACATADLSGARIGETCEFGTIHLLQSGGEIPGEIGVDVIVAGLSVCIFVDEDGTVHVPCTSL